MQSVPRRAEQKQRSAGQTAKAAVRNSVQREPDLVLPKKQNSGNSVSEKTESVIRREFDRNTEQPDSSVSDAGKKPEPVKAPQASFGQNGFMGIGPSPSVNHFPGVQPGLIQREPLDNFEPNIIQREPLTENETENDTSSDLQEVKDDIEEARVPVTPMQLDRLADKLVPRIKRLMRAEMERSVFR